MRKILKVFLITCGVIVTAYGIYFLLGRPPIPLPAVNYSVSQGSRIYKIIKATESDKVTITWKSSGTIEALADGSSMAGISYDINSFENALALGEKFLLTSDTQKQIKTIITKFPPVSLIPKIAAGFFYHVVRLKITVNLIAK